MSNKILLFVVNYILLFYPPFEKASSTTGYQFITVGTVGDRSNVGLITLNRPQVLNALSSGLMTEVVEALAKFDSDAQIAATVITGEGKAFAGKVAQRK